MINISDIKSADWSLATESAGDVVEGIFDINQCIVTILATQKGSDPFRPDFGSDVWDWIDRPLNVAVPNMKRAIYEAIGLWEPRVIVTQVAHTYQNIEGRPEPVYSGIKFDIGWRLKGTQTTNSVEFTLGIYNALIKKALTTPTTSITSLLTTEQSDPLLTEQSLNISV